MVIVTKKIESEKITDALQFLFPESWDRAIFDLLPKSPSRRNGESLKKLSHNILDFAMKTSKKVKW